MTTLTMEQRRHDFEVMLAHADRARQAISKFWATEEDTPGKPIATLARDVAELCTAWATNAKRAQTHRPSGQMKDLAILVAARCLQAITELEGVQGIPFEDLRAAMVDDAEEYFGAHSDEWLDLGVDPCLRVQSLLGALGEVAGCWPISPDRPNPYGGDPEEWQFSTLFRLLFEAICAALAAERGLWQEEES